MLDRRVFSSVVSVLLLFVGSARAEQRYFVFTGTVTRSENHAVAQVGSRIRGTFNYDVEMVGDYTGDMIAFYDLDTEFVGRVDGHDVVTDRAFVYLIDIPGGGDLFDLYSTPGIMIDDDFLPTGRLGFRLLGTGLHSRNLPGAFDLSLFDYAAGVIMQDDNGTVLAEFSVDDISLCLKKNGKPDKHCKENSP